MSSLGDGTRRSFLVTLGSSLLGLLLHPALSRAASASDEAEEFARRLSETFGDPPSRRAIGRAYLQQRPADADAGVLLEAIRASRLLGGLDLDGLTRSERRSWLARQIQDDFRSGRIVAVRGWMLSLTEARLCALACLL